MRKKRIIVAIVFISVIVMAISIVGLYQTFATDSSIDATSSATYSVSLGDSSTVTVPPNSSKTIYYKLTNTNNGIVRYGIAYSGTNIVVSVWDNSNDSVSGTINYMENKFIKLYVKNNGTVSSTATISAILGYENDENLIVPSGYTLVTRSYPPSGANMISYLYNPTKTASNNNITYNLDDTNKLMEDVDGNLRYYGANPNNYIYFNCTTYPETGCETWRIIGVFDGKIKIMRNSYIGTLAWDQDKNQTGVSGYNNNWSTSSLRDLLNNEYYYGDTSGTVTQYYGSSGTSNKTINMTSVGIKNDTTRRLISDSIYYLRGHNSASVYSDQIYTYERETGSLYDSTWPTTITDKIALPYPSDYGYAADLSLCSQTLSNYNNSTCTSNNWMKTILTSSYNWLITPRSSSSNNAWYVHSSGNVGNLSNFVFNAYGVSPVLYLNSELVIESGNGDGSSSNPYRISVS